MSQPVSTSIDEQHVPAAACPLNLNVGALRRAVPQDAREDIDLWTG